MDCPMWWDEETVTTVVHRTECTIAARSCYRYAINQYFYKIRKNTYLKIFTCIIKMMYYIHSS
jgi:hypothetical protein